MTLVNDFENIARCCQLHEEVKVYYVVDGYMAGLYTRDGERLVIETKGESILEAVRGLDERLEVETLQSIRAMEELRFAEDR